MEVSSKDTEGLEPLRLLVEMGMDKLKRDYLAFFIGKLIFKILTMARREAAGKTLANQVQITIIKKEDFSGIVQV